MSVTGFWVVGVVSDRDIARVERESPGAVAYGCPGPEGNGSLEWWRGRSPQESFFDPGPSGPVPKEQALRLQDALDAMRPADDQHEAIKEELLQLVPQGEGVGLFCASTRKGDPFAALDYALGPEVMAQLPAGVESSFSTRPTSARLFRVRRPHSASHRNAGAASRSASGTGLRG